MITDYAQMSIKMRSLLNNEEAKNAINKALSTYPLYAPKTHVDLIPTRDELNKRILNNYKGREIAFETVGRFLEELEFTMCEIMPYYNELFKTVEIMAGIDDPFGNVDFTETYEETRTDSATSQGETTSTSNNANTTATESNSSTISKNKFSDTPQNHVDNIDNYLTEYREQNDVNNGEASETVTSNGTGTATSTGSSESTGTTRHTFTKKGNQGVNTYAHDMIEFRTSIRDIVNEIVNDYRIQNLFMLIW